MIHTTETLDWCVIHTYQPSPDFPKVELTLPFEEMRNICEKHDIYPILGCREASYAAFKDWLDKHDDHKEKFYGSRGYDIYSLVDLFDKDLRNTVKIQRYTEMGRNDR